MSLPSYKIDSIEETSSVITRWFMITIELSSYEWEIITQIPDDRPSLAEHELKWLTPWHPNLDSDEEQSLIQHLFSVL